MIMDKTKRFQVRIHENCKEFYVEDTTTGKKVGFGALSFTNMTTAEILCAALETAYVNGKNVAYQHAREMIEQAK